MKETMLLNTKLCSLIAMAGAAVALSPAPANAVEAVHAQLRECAQIAKDSRRLKCFDKLARRSAPNETSAAIMPASPATPVNPAPKPSPAPSQPVTVATHTPQAGGANESMVITEADFGLEDKRIAESIQEIVTRYDGDFSGWSGKTLFRLENGQVWKQAQNGRVSYRASRPQITIKRGALGSFRMAVEGLNRTVRVVRIK